MKDLETTLNKVFVIKIKYLEDNSKVFDYQTANVLKEKIDLTLPNDGVALEELLPIVQFYLQYSVRTGSTH